MANGNNPARGPHAKPAPKNPVWRKNVVSTDPCVWSDIDPSTLRGVVDAVARSGGAIMFGVTSDGGAYSVCILQNDEKIKEYPHSKLECQEILRSIIEWYADFKL